MIYELRIYDATPGKMKALTDRFVNHTLGLFKKHGIRTTLFLEPVIGTSNQLIYLVEWENMAEREEKWGAFQTDPEWISARSASEKDGSLTAKVTNSLLRESPDIMKIIRGNA
ncbi:MAG TPA: NIPSNAP family protein [Chloroflexota bacterium]